MFPKTTLQYKIPEYSYNESGFKKIYIIGSVWFNFDVMALVSI